MCFSDENIYIDRMTANTILPLDTVSVPTTTGIQLPQYYGSEKSSVVLEFGSAYTKCGFAGESSPRQIVPANFFLHKHRLDSSANNYTEQVRVLQ